MKNSDTPAMPIKLYERAENAHTGEVVITECENYMAGLTKREHIAANILSGIASNERLATCYSKGRLVEMSIALTDLLLEELEK